MRPSLFVVLVFLFAAPRAGAMENVQFNRDVRPILSDNCFDCHGPDEAQRKANLRLDTPDGWLADLDGSQAVVPGDVAKSTLIHHVTSKDRDKVMPPVSANRSLTDEQIRTLEKWIEQGAAWQPLWSFVKPTRPQLPKVDAEGWPRNGIDHFILARLEAEDIEPSPQAAKQRLLRRVTLDLTGLPPTLEQIDAFMADSSPNAYEKVVDRLLDSPHFGERMAWPWLEASRYADSNGYQGDSDRTMWPWRDWVIRSLNQNMRYDQFTIWQLAGDLLPDATHEQVLATGFNRNHMINGEGGRIAEENRVEYIFDQTETVGTIWLGLTLNCCRCHDHKYDPISQKEYYALFAFFNQTPIDGDGGNPQTPPIIEAPSDEHQRKQQEIQREFDETVKRVMALEAPIDWDASADSGDGDEVGKILKLKPTDRSDKELEIIEKHFEGSQPQYVKQLREIRELRKREDALKRSFPRVMVMRDMDKPRKTFILEKGLYNQRKEEVTADVFENLLPLPPGDAKNRLALAKWLMHDDHPLTARVTVNRIWQEFFGSGLVKTSEDFGSQGHVPEHTSLLDWLAVEFRESGWDVKAMCRLIVTSSTYRQSAMVKSDLLAFDPENRLLARGPRHRMPSWMIRDHALAASGLLVDKIAGPPVKPYQPAGVWAETSFGKKRYLQSKGDDLYRRSIYTFWRRIVGPTLFFDVSARQTCVVKPTRTNTPLHALATMNDVTYVEAARAMAQQVMKKAGEDPSSRIIMAFRLSTARVPTQKELDVLANRLDILKDQYTQQPDEAEKLLAVGDSKRDESLNAIEHAAYTSICSLILNLDESLTK